jgi:hypothetical protein
MFWVHLECESAGCFSLRNTGWADEAGRHGMAIRKLENRKFEVFSGHSVFTVPGKRLSHVDSSLTISGSSVRKKIRNLTQFRLPDCHTVQPEFHRVSSSHPFTSHSTVTVTVTLSQSQLTTATVTVTSGVVTYHSMCSTQNLRLSSMGSCNSCRWTGVTGVHASHFQWISYGARRRRRDSD